MRVVNFRDDTLYGIAALLGIDPTVDLLNDQARQWVSLINANVRYALEFWDWPELMITEERAFRQVWDASSQFLRVSADGTPDELYYVAGNQYYQVKSTAPGDPPVGTLPTNTTYFSAITPSDRYIAYDQPGRRGIGQIYGMWSSDPRAGTWVQSVDYEPSEKGIDVGWNAGNTAWLTYKIRPPVFTTTAWDAGTSYVRGDTAYYTDGQVYRAAASSLNVTPAAGILSGKWALVPMPYLLAPYVKYATAADAADDVQSNAMLRSQGIEYLRTEVDKLIQQGQRHFYNTRRRSRCQLAGVAGYAGLPTV